MKNFWILLLILCSCVSVRLEKPVENTRAKNYSLETPREGFQSRSKDTFDLYWIHPETGNTISVQTSCNQTADPTLENLLQKSLAGIGDLANEKTDRIFYNDREAIKSIHTGNVDGVSVKIKTLVFKKNHCNYSLNYFGVKNDFNRQEAVFDRFLRNFRVK